MPTKKFTKEELIDVCNEESDYLEDIKTVLEDTSRWSLEYSQIFRDTRDNKYYQTYYRTAATEQQDERPYEYGDAEIECVEVHEVEVTVKQFLVVP